MSKKNFIALADAIREHNRLAAYIDAPSGEQRFTKDQIDTLARFCAQQNGQFNRQRWLDYINGECGPNGGKPK